MSAASLLLQRPCSPIPTPDNPPTHSVRLFFSIEFLGGCVRKYITNTQCKASFLMIFWGLVCDIIFLQRMMAWTFDCCGWHMVDFTLIRHSLGSVLQKYMDTFFCPNKFPSRCTNHGEWAAGRAGLWEMKNMNLIGWTWP